jgi:hypothetical protein
VDSSRNIAPRLAFAALLLLGLGGCDSSPSEPLDGMNVLLEGTFVAMLETIDEEEVVVVEPIEHRQVLTEEGLVRIELVALHGMDAETEETGDLDPSIVLPLDIGRVQPDGSCDQGFDAGLRRGEQQVFRLSAVEYCFTVLQPVSAAGTRVLSAGDTATYAVSLTDTE